MKNSLLKCLLFTIVIIALFFFDAIVIYTYLFSDLMWNNSNFDVMCLVFGILFGITFFVFLFYLLKNYEKKGIVTPVSFKSPNDMTPIEVGFLVDGVIDSSDISAMLVYWAGKRFISITKDGKKIIKKIDKLPENSKPFECKLFNEIFKNKKEVLVDQISANVNTNVVTQCVSEVENQIGKIYFNKKTMLYRQIFIAIFAVLYLFSVLYFRLEYYFDVVPIVEIFGIVSTCLYLLSADFYLKYYDYRFKNNKSKLKTFSLIILIIVMLAIGGLSIYFFYTDLYQMIFLICVSILMFVVCFFSKKIDIYTKDGRKLLGNIIGFRDYIVVTKKDRIQMLAKENPNFYYDILPYAFVLGVSDVWIKKLQVLSQDNPEIIPEKIIDRIIVYSVIFSNPNLNFISAIKIAQTGKILGTVLNFGSSSNGGNKGGSNFGGIRRR